MSSGGAQHLRQHPTNNPPAARPLQPPLLLLLLLAPPQTMQLHTRPNACWHHSRWYCAVLRSGCWPLRKTAAHVTAGIVELLMGFLLECGLLSRAHAQLTVFAHCLAPSREASILACGWRPVLQRPDA